MERIEKGRLCYLCNRNSRALRLGSAFGGVVECRVAAENTAEEVDHMAISQNSDVGCAAGVAEVVRREEDSGIRQRPIPYVSESERVEHCGVTARPEQ